MAALAGCAASPRAALQRWNGRERRRHARSRRAARLAALRAGMGVAPAWAHAVARTRHYQRPKNSRGRARRAAVLAMDRMPAPAQQQGRVRAGFVLTTEILLQGGRICGALNLALRTGVLEGEVLVRELLAVDGLATGTVAAGEVLLLLVPKWCCWCCWCC